MGLFRKEKPGKPEPIPFEKTKFGKWSQVGGCTLVHFDDFTVDGPWLLRCNCCFALIDGNYASEHQRMCTR